MFNIIGKRKYWFSLSAILVIVSLFSIALWGLNLGIDFTGGALLEIKISGTDIPVEQIQATLDEQGILSSAIQPTDDGVWLIRTENINEEVHQSILNGLQQVVIASSANGEGIVTELRFESIGPTIGKELKGKAITSIIVVLIAIVIYIALAFRKVSFPVESWKYGLSAIIALAHDILITLGLFSVLGHFLNYQVDSLIITALLTIMGFSVHDTIVTFDRTRENLFKTHNLTFAEVVNNSINETIIRSLNTSLTTLLILLSVYLFGGASISQFILALLFGIIIGTYSSIFLASPLLMVWYKMKKG